MSLQLDHKDFLTRAKELSRNNLLFIFSIIKAASIGLGVTAFLNLFLDLPPEWSWESLGHQIPKFLLWVVSYASLLLTFDVAMFTSLFLVHIPKRSETFFTFLLVGLEGLQFAILKPITDHSVTRVMSVELINWWYAIFFFYCLTITALIMYGKKEIKLTSFKDSMKPYVKRYLRKFNVGIAFALTAAFISFILFFILTLTPFSKSNLIISSSLTFIIIIYVGFEIHHKQRRMFEKNINKSNRTQDQA